MDNLKRHNLFVYVSVFSVILVLFLVALVGVNFAEAESVSLEQAIFFEIGGAKLFEKVRDRG
jgi:hypothetical protein